MFSPSKVNLVNMALSKLGSDRLQITDFNTDDTIAGTQARLHYDFVVEYLSRLHTWQVTSSWKRLTPQAFQVTCIGGTNIPDFTEKLYRVKTPWEGQSTNPTYAVSLGDSWSTTETIQYVTDRWIVYTKNNSDVKTAILENVTSDDEVPPRSGWTVVSALSSSVTNSEVKEFRPQAKWKYAYQLPTNCIRVKYVTNTKQSEEHSIPNVYWALDEDTLLTNESDIYICFNRGISLEQSATGMRSSGQQDIIFIECFVTLLASKMAVAITGDKELEQELLQEFYNIHLPEAKRVNGFEQNQQPVLDSEWLEATYTSNSVSSNSLPPFSQTSYGTFE